MSITFFNYYILGILHVPFIYVVPNVHNVKKSKAIFGGLAIMLSDTIIVFCIPEYTTYLCFTLSLLIIYLISINKISAIFFSCINYICYIETGYILLLIMDILFNISETQMMTNDTYNIVYHMLLSIILISISFVFSKLHLKFLYSSLASNKKSAALMDVFVISCLALYLFNITYEAEKGFPQEIVTYNSLIFSLFFILTAVFLFIFIKLILQNEQLKYQNLQYEALQDYTKKTEMLYNEMREFKHEYLNKLLIMHFYINSGDIDKLKEYYKANILPTKNNLETNFQTFLSLVNIHVPEFKALVYNKLVRADSLGIKVKIEIKNEIKDLCSYEKEITELVGIYLDNAIDETAPSETNKNNHIHFKALYDINMLTITVSNSINSPNIYMDKINQWGFSTKGKNRGLGLHIAKTILEKCPYIKHNTYVKDDIFYQSLQIEVKADV